MKSSGKDCEKKWLEIHEQGMECIILRHHSAFGGA
jgi:hypothetical protein